MPGRTSILAGAALAGAWPGLLLAADAPGGGASGARLGAVPGMATTGSASPGAFAYSVEYLLGVVLVLVALGALAWVARRLQGQGAFGRGALRVESSLPLGGKERLMIVEVEGRRLLLGVGAGGVRTLSRLAPREGQPSPAPLAPGSWLARTLGREGA